MKIITKYHKRLHISFLKATIFALFVEMFFLPYIKGVDMRDDNTFMVVVNGVSCGTVGDRSEAEEYLRLARKSLAATNSELLLMEADMSLVGSKQYFGTLDDKSKVIANIKNALSSQEIVTFRRAYTVKVNEITVNLATIEDVEALFNAAIDKYDVDNHFTVSIVQDADRKLNVLTTLVESDQEIELAADKEDGTVHRDAGIEQALNTAIVDTSTQVEELTFEDYEYGIISMGFDKEIEVVEAYLPTAQLSTVEEAAALLTEEQEQQQIYTVVKGDTLSGISTALNVPVDDLIAMNAALESDKTKIYAGQELIITVPKPELSVVWQEQGFYDEYYDAPTVYVNLENEYTSYKKVLKEPVTGRRKTVAVKTYTNNTESDSFIIKEEIVVAAEAKIVERGTIVPPTYVYPISGAKITSGFGPRNIKVKGASKYHKGIDFKAAYGTRVHASCDGRVVKAGWANGYGYVVCIKHSDGKETRYAHLSKILVKVGQYVNQGDTVALSGNSGVSSGPHLHFEILVNGAQKNPLNYLSR